MKHILFHIFCYFVSYVLMVIAVNIGRNHDELPTPFENNWWVINLFIILAIWIAS